MEELNNIVVHVHEFIRPGGGPSGYLYNLQAGLERIEDPLVKVVALNKQTSREFDAHISSRSFRARLVNALPRELAWRLLLNKDIRAWNRKVPEVILREIQIAKVIVFHSPVLAANYLGHHYIEGQHIFVMTHSPTDMASEKAENLRLRFGENGFVRGYRRRLAEIEMRIYTQCHGIVAPSITSLEAYFEWDTELRREFEKLPVVVVPSGVPSFADVTTQDRDEVRRQLGISPDKLTIGFFGRYHPHKGFDTFLEIVKQCVNEEGLYFVSAGDGPLKPTAGWHNYKDLGWLSTALPDAINAVDVIVAPNKVSYFDLLLLEAMSLGKVIIASNVGGNKTFTTPGIRLVDANDVQAFRDVLLGLKSEYIEQWGSENRELYENKYTIDKFIENHVSFAELVLIG
ncbi:MAG: glycosyltransferase family 4 protein [Alicyclobacillus sp.]|nr:glycosyltransferase family 4 protein [Alicyclobacillus sp.]